MGNPLSMDVEETLPQAARERIRIHLDWLLGTTAFASSKRSCAFLRYVVEETLAGRSAHIKERVIGVDVFGRDARFDPQEESLVRVSAGEVRRRLARAYEEEGVSDIRVELPVGSYCPVFRLQEPPFAPPSLLDTAMTSPAVAVQSLGPPLDAASSAPPTHLRTKPAAWFALAVLVSLTITIAFALSSYFGANTRRRPLDVLWEPFAQGKQPVLIAMPAPRVYELPLSAVSEPLPSSDVIPAVRLKPSDGDYVGLGAAMGAARFAEQLAQRHQAFLLKSGKDVSFSDLSHAPAILLGGYTSNLGIELTRKLRFSLVIDATTNRIMDKSGSTQPWVIRRWGPPAEDPEGYALVTILRDSETGYPLMIVAGMRISDTQAAVDFLTNADYFRAFTRIAPEAWGTKNCQIVLHSFDHSGSPGRPEVVAYHFW